MIIEYKTLELFDKMVFEKVVLKPPFKKQFPLPDEACMLYIIEGRYRSISETAQLEVFKKEAVLMKCGNYLAQMFSSDTSEHYEAIAAHFYPDTLKKIYKNEVPGFLKDPQKAPLVSSMARIKADEHLQKYIDGILFLFANPELATEELLTIKVKELILLLANTEHAPAIHQILSNLFTPRSNSFREIVEAHVFSNITIHELAQLTNLSLSSFKREFRKIYDVNPSDYIKTRRMEKSAELLVITDWNITEIAYDCGFNDSAYFSTVFKKYYHVSPFEYRLSQKNK